MYKHLLDFHILFAHRKKISKANKITYNQGYGSRWIFPGSGSNLRENTGAGSDLPEKKIDTEPIYNFDLIK